MKGARTSAVRITMREHPPKENHHGQRTTAQNQRSEEAQEKTDTRYLIYGFN
jgi:hypothetical protein